MLCWLGWALGTRTSNRYIYFVTRLLLLANFHLHRQFPLLLKRSLRCFYPCSYAHFPRTQICQMLVSAAWIVHGSCHHSSDVSIL